MKKTRTRKKSLVAFAVNRTTLAYPSHPPTWPDPIRKETSKTLLYSITPSQVQTRYKTMLVAYLSNAIFVKSGSMVAVSA
jgi:hypothetical protein